MNDASDRSQLIGSVDPAECARPSVTGAVVLDLLIEFERALTAIFAAELSDAEFAGMVAFPTHTS